MQKNIFFTNMTTKNNEQIFIKLCSDNGYHTTQTTLPSRHWLDTIYKITPSDTTTNRTKESTDRSRREQCKQGRRNRRLSKLGIGG